MSARPPGAARCFWALAAIPYALLAVALVDWLHIPFGAVARDPWLALTSAAVAVTGTVELVWRIAIAQALIGALPLALARAGARRGPLLAAVAVACLVIVAVSYLVLVEYYPFDGYPPFLAAGVALWLGLSLTYATVLLDHRFRLVMAIGTAGVLAVTLYVNAAMYRGLYPTLHASLAMLSYALAHAAATAALAARPWPRRWLLISAPAAALATVALVAGALTGESSRATAYARAYTTAGRHEIFRGGGRARDQCLEPVTVPEPAAARALFDEHANLPALPAGFRIDEHNLLLLMIDATRFDDTSFGGQATTPNLARFAADGAFVFERAYSPSSRTVVSLGSVFDMTYPSHARMRSQIPPWVATLSEDVVTPAELFAAAGHTTFRYNHAFPARYSPEGFFQGFARNREWPVATDDEKRRADPEIADAAVAELERLAASGERFFGWVFFVGPHMPYLGGDPPADTKRGRYREDIQRTDALIGRILDTLRSTGLLDTTVVLFVADHGEEFGEHGFNSHGLSLYEAGTHVPMLLWIPGARGTVVSEPTSVTYVWPWLAATGTDDMRALAAARIREHFAPMLAAVDGAIVTELNDTERFQTALVTADARAIYDFQSGLYHVYDRAADPAEQRDLAVEDPEAARPWIERLDRYRALRACQRRVEISGDQATARQ